MKEYIGGELELFKHAYNWKTYFSKILKKYIRGDVLEVGAGIGENTNILFDGTQISWLCIEPDSYLSKAILEKKENGYLPSKIKILTSTVNELQKSKKFDCILYIDVLEHIKHDTEEVIMASKLLKENGILIILAPAHNFLFSEFDKAIGHYRRYNRKMLKKILNFNLEIVELKYLDSLGLFASLMNKFFLKQEYPTIEQIKFWDKKIIPISKIIDKLSFYVFGKTVIGDWKKQKQTK